MLKPSDAKLLILALLLSCGVREKSKPANPIPSPIDNIDAIAYAYDAMLPDIADKFGWVESDKCDALLWNSLLAANGSRIDLTTARDESGKWFRTPYRDCYDNEKNNVESTRKSASDISKDSMVGLAWYFWRGYREDLASEYLEYGRKNFWIMGRGPVSRTLMSANLQRTFALIAKEKQPVFDDIWQMPSKDFERHIAILHILLRAEIRDEITAPMLEIVNACYESDRLNALFSYAYHKFFDGEQSETLALVYPSPLFPIDRLPDNRDRCGRWLWERESSSKHWKPCDESRTHSGGDFRMVANMLIRDARQ